ncbi:MAG TPA: hypothetical protein VGG10_15075 [Rhizomicrobium sp.]|jgi:hypothetical protein
MGSFEDPDKFRHLARNPRVAEGLKLYREHKQLEAEWTEMMAHAGFEGADSDLETEN